ncbi:MAG: hypothetical protein Q7R81_02935 [Candidatus Peregrinibacteria bacterium]|nr:hypothetical protein [Candidatus Peregrinibacteria bacterium]
MYGSPRLTALEEQVIEDCTTPEDVQDFINRHIEYCTNREGHVKTFRQVLRTKTAQCLEGSLFAASVLSHHRHPPQILCAERNGIDHCAALVQRPQSGWWGSVDQSVGESIMRFRPDLLSLAGCFGEYKEVRGFTHIDLRRIKMNWQTGNNAACIEKLLFDVPYLSIHGPRKGDFYLSDFHSRRTWLSHHDVSDLRRKIGAVLALKDLVAYEKEHNRNTAA